jgi:hypothetical protein
VVRNAGPGSLPSGSHTSEMPTCTHCIEVLVTDGCIVQLGSHGRSKSHPQGMMEAAKCSSRL